MGRARRQSTLIKSS